MTMVDIGVEYGEQYQGSYRVEVLSWKQGRELIRKAMKSKDPTSYIEDLILACVSGPVELKNREQLEALPTGLVRRLMDEALRLNDVSKAESAFLSS